MTLTIFSKKWLVAALAAPALMPMNSEAVLVIAGLTDGDLPGGNPKAIILQAVAPIADMTVWGVGSANNGGGTDGQEFTFPAGTASSGDVFVLPGNADSFDFFANNFVQNFVLLDPSGAALINGDDAIEVFGGGAVVDLFGDIDVDGTGTPWEYLDGFVSRNPVGPSSTFDLANYTIVNGGFDGLDEAGHLAIFEAAGFTVVPEPTAAALALLGCGLLFRRRR